MLFEQFEGRWLSDPELADQARANTLENFALAFNKKFFDSVFTCMDINQETFKRITDDEAFAATLREYYQRRVYGTLRAGTPEPTA